MTTEITPIDLRLYVNAREPDAEGFLYATDARLADVGMIARSVVDSGYPIVGGGILILTPGRIWNRPLVSTPIAERLAGVFDRLTFSRLFVEHYCTFLVSHTAIQTSLDGSDEIFIREASASVARISGRMSNGSPYPGSLFVEKLHLCQKLSDIIDKILLVLSNIAEHVAAIGADSDPFLHQNEVDEWRRSQGALQIQMEHLP